MKCKHREVSVDNWTGDHWEHVARYAGPPMASHVAKLGGRAKCVDCSAWLGLGESNDEPEAVKVEMRAAELATESAKGWLIEDATSEECDGWRLAETRFLVATDGYHAGYLAHAIATHQDPTE